MINLLVGKKGSGKTKRLISCANTALETSKGNVVVIEKGLKLTYDISHEARLIDLDAYKIKGADALYGFISGICAENYDITDILLDSTLKVIGSDMEALESFVLKVEALENTANIKIVLSVSADETEIPASIADKILK